MDEEEVFPFLQETGELTPRNYGTLAHSPAVQNDSTIHEVMLASGLDTSPPELCNWKLYFMIFLFALFCLLVIRVVTHPNAIAKLF